MQSAVVEGVVVAVEDVGVVLHQDQVQVQVMEEAVEAVEVDVEGDVAVVGYKLITN